MVRKSELTDATWGEINFSSGISTIPAERMKRRNPPQRLFVNSGCRHLYRLRTCAGGSRYVLPSRYDADLPISNATLNQLATSVLRVARAAGRPLADFSPQDLRRTASTQLHEAGYNTDWIEKCLVHEQRGVGRCTTRPSMRNSGARCCSTGPT
ncbi:tyrosine-type recombinase/integrase [Pseudoduganella sp. UC29_71]|uniref:tyrosine-type recombinase/integrase n=1 Tax=Pseudoduganella sp. UC29_71 TaxID=3350174 RepID=UPI00366C067E